MELEPVELAYEESGQGIPVVLLHGFPLTRKIWEPVRPYIAEKARVILPDLRGYGKSPDGKAAHSMRLYAEDLRQLLDRMALEKVILLGHSMGGYAALAFAHAYPHRLAGLGLIASQAEDDNPEKRQARLVQARKVLKKGIGVVAAGMAEKLTHDSALYPQINEIMMATRPETASASLKAMAERPDASAWLPGIKIPTLVLAGSEDQIIPLNKAETIVQLLSKGWLVQVAGAGHMPMMEAPKKTAEAILQLICSAGGC